MGIPGLWAELAPAAQTTTLASYCLTTFAENRNELRGLRLGIDASLWLFHAHQSSGGANPYLRLLFYRLAKLLSLPVLPVFVFDGPNRPTWKRGKQVKGKQHAIEQPFTQLIEAFGYQWHRAPGEAEAELAYLNQAGLVDAVLTDDSDALLFGTQVLIRNWGKNLSGTKAFSRTASSSSDVFEDVAPSTHAPTVALAASRLQLSGSDRDHLITLYSAGDLSSTSKVGLDRDGLILIGLMSGGDYDTTGLLQCGVKIALALARGGFGTTLIKAFKASYSDQTSAHKTCATFQRFLRFWLEEVREELRTNQRGFLPSRRPKLASTIEESFLSTQESRRVLACYVYPLTSQSVEIGINGPTRSKMMEPDLTRLARLSQLYFNWSKDAILSKFRTILGPGVVVRRLRQEVLEHNDGAAEGPWAALVESPASKAVRRHALGVDASGSGSSLAATQNASKDVHQLSKHATVAASQKKQKQRPSHESPNATRITDFFGKAAIGIESRVLTPVETAFSTTPPSPAPANSVEIIAIKMQRRHAALDPFLDYRLLVSVEEFIAAAELGIDVSLDAELEDRRAQDNDFDSDALEDEDAEPAARSRSGTTKQKVPSNSPLLMWMPEPLLQLSASGAAPLKAFLNEIERKADATRAKELKKKVGKTDAGKGSQMTLTSFVKPVAKASLASQHVRMTQKGVLSVSSTSSTSGESTLKQDKVGKETGPPRTPRQLRVPSGMQRGLRRTESVPVPVSAPATGTSSTVLAAPALLPRRRLEKHISLPNQEPALQTSAEIAAEDDWDSSIEFLGAFVSDRRAASSAVAVHSRPSTPPSNTDGEESRPNKSPRKHRTAAPRPPSISSGRTLPPSQRALAEPSSHDSGSHSDSDDGHGETREIATSARVKSFGTALAQAIPKRPAKPRISSITISDSSSDEAG